jgi:hypothetical protein
MIRLIQEGLQKGDLNGMILPLLSVDEYESKIDDKNVIVVTFYCFEEDPAHDLSNFIERSPHTPLDTDVSPAPSKEGYYLTFVEIKRNSEFVDKLLNILKEVHNLTDVTEWQFTSNQLPKGKVLSVTKQNLEKHVQTEPVADKTTVTTKKLSEWLQHSSLHDFELQENQLTLIRSSQHVTYEVVQFQDQIPTGALQLSEHVVHEAKMLERMLAGAYTVWPMHNHMVIHNQIQDTYLVLKAKT